LCIADREYGDDAMLMLNKPMPVIKLNIYLLNLFRLQDLF
jgi:hypothetical protein